MGRMKDLLIDTYYDAEIAMNNDAFNEEVKKVTHRMSLGDFCSDSSLKFGKQTTHYYAHMSRSKDYAHIEKITHCEHDDDNNMCIGIGGTVSVCYDYNRNEDFYYEIEIYGIKRYLEERWGVEDIEIYRDDETFEMIIKDDYASPDHLNRIVAEIIALIINVKEARTNIV